MFERRGALISVPAGDIASLKVPRSIFEAKQFLEYDVAPDLKSAVTVLKDIAESEGGRAMIVARPEMFTNGETIDWLRRQIAPIRDHVSISDGRTIRVIPSLDNHAFFLRLGIRRNSSFLDALQKRCPELINGLRSQINSALSFPSARDLPTLVLQSSGPSYFSAPFFLPFCLVRHSVEATLERIASAGRLDLARTFADCSRIVYAPLTEVALASEGFRRLIVREIARTFFDKSTTMILALPEIDGGARDVASRISALVMALRGIPGAIPAVPSERVILASSPCPETTLFSRHCKVELILHHTVDAWGHSPEYYSKFERVLVTASTPSTQRNLFIEYIEHLLGRSAKFYWLEHTSMEPNDSGLASAC
jgi:hypothetical protein